MLGEKHMMALELNFWPYIGLGNYYQQVLPGVEFPSRLALHFC